MYKNILMEVIKNLSDENCREICNSIMNALLFDAPSEPKEKPTETEEVYADKRFETASICAQYLEDLGFKKLSTYNYHKGTITAAIKININGFGWVVHFD